MTGGEKDRMRYFMNRLVWVVSIFAMIAVATSCGKAEEKASELAAEKAIESAAAADGQKVDVDLSGHKVTIETEQGTTKIDGSAMSMTSNDGNVKIVGGENAVIPADFPKDVPIYPGAKVMLAATDANEQSSTVTLQVKDTVDNVSEFVAKETAAQGWKEEMVIKQPGDQPMHMLSYKTHNRTVMYTIVGEGENVNISMTVMTEDQTSEAAPAPEPAAEETPAEPAQPQ